MITCRELAELLFDLSRGELSPEQAKHVEEHVHECCHCAAYVETYHLTIDLTRKLPRPPLPTHLVKKLETIVSGASCPPHQDGDGAL
jgi:anti-sigma factor RsiW